MTVIYKAPLAPGAVTVVEGFITAHPISVGLDANGIPCVWFEHHGEGGRLDIEIQTVPTGVEFQRHGAFLGTFVMPAEGLVFHCYWRMVKT